MTKLLLSLIISLIACPAINAKRLFVEMEYHKNSIKLDDGSTKKRQPIKDKTERHTPRVLVLGRH